MWEHRAQIYSWKVNMLCNLSAADEGERTFWLVYCPYVRCVIMCFCLSAIYGRVWCVWAPVPACLLCLVSGNSVTAWKRRAWPGMPPAPLQGFEKCTSLQNVMLTTARKTLNTPPLSPLLSSFVKSSSFIFTCRKCKCHQTLYAVSARCRGTCMPMH